VLASRRTLEGGYLAMVGHFGRTKLTCAYNPDDGYLLVGKCINVIKEVHPPSP
jgi:hypothetical protein